MSNDLPEEAIKIVVEWWGERLMIPEKREDFKQSLLPKIHAEMQLTVDYDPFGILLNTLLEAGIECSGHLYSAKGILPMKTCMNIWGNEKIEAKEGYGEPFETLWEKQAND